MAETPNVPLLPALIELSKIDIRIAILTVERKRTEASVASQSQALATEVAKRDAKARVLADKQGLVVREEKAVKLERDKINERRRALNTLGSYKLQQAAEREITYVSKELGKREDLLLGIMREVEVLERDVSEMETRISGLKAELTAAQQDAASSIQSISEQLAEAQRARTEQAQAIGQGSVLSTYNRVIARFPSDPIVPVFAKDSCGGCHIKVGPQVIVQLSRGDVVKCQGCGRLLRLPEE